MKNTCRIAAVLAALAAAPLVLAEDKPMAPPKPAPEMSQLAYFTGAWHCTGKTFATPMGPEHASEGIAHGQMALDGFRLVIHYDETKTAANPMPYHVLQVVGWDAGQKVFDSVCFDDFGSACTQTASGWKEGAFTFEGTANMGGQKMGVRDTFTKVSATEMTHKGEMQGEDGKWMTGDQETCHKAGKAAAKK
ncbi:MAG TPA: DUF1579 family protein [Thermoanaerobaculia bacterium]|nr:DUF1579 family protein [Thermoanaerobaculia bacterium]